MAETRPLPSFNFIVQKYKKGTWKTKIKYKSFGF